MIDNHHQAIEAHALGRWLDGLRAAGVVELQLDYEIDDDGTRVYGVPLTLRCGPLQRYLGELEEHTGPGFGTLHIDVENGQLTFDHTERITSYQGSNFRRQLPGR